MFPSSIVFLDLQYKMFLLNNGELTGTKTVQINLQYKMFLLNLPEKTKIYGKTVDLQYKMFLLNSSNINTISNYLLIYNTKCFY